MSSADTASGATPRLSASLRRSLARVDLQVDLSCGAEIVALVGPSGSGKSMTIKMLAGSEMPDSGRIALDGVDLFNRQRGVNLPAQARRVGYVPQQAALFPHLSALDNVAFPLRYAQGLSRRAAREQAHGFLQRVNLPDVASARPAQLSGGQQQRVALARALATRPRLLLLDEPFGALDPPVRAELGEELRRLQAQEQIPVIFVTHDLQEAATLATRVAVLIEGRVRQVGRGRDILTRPVDRNVALLTRARNILPGEIVATADGLAVRTAIGDLPLADTAPPHDEGRQVDVVVRPEAWRVSPGDVAHSPAAESAHAVFTTTGSVLETRDYGLHLLLRVAVGAGVLEVLQGPTAGLHAAQAPLPGTPVRLSIAADDVHLLRPEV